MSNKLHKKTKLKPWGYDKCLDLHQQIKDKSFSLNCFSEVFASMQYLSLAALYSSKEDGGSDFTEEELKQFNAILKDNAREYDNHGITFLNMLNEHKDTLHFDCTAQAANFPYRAKIKMYGKPLKTKREYGIALYSINESIETYLVFAVQTLCNNFSFSKNMVDAWWKKCIELSGLYAQGMTDAFILQFLKEECGLNI